MDRVRRALTQFLSHRSKRKIRHNAALFLSLKVGLFATKKLRAASKLQLRLACGATSLGVMAGSRALRANDRADFLDQMLKTPAPKQAKRSLVSIPVAWWVSGVWIINQAATYLLPIAIVWWVLALCDCPQKIAAVLACLLAVSVWPVLRGTLD